MKSIIIGAGCRLALTIGLAVTATGWNGTGLAADGELHEEGSDRKPAVTNGIDAEGGASLAGVADVLYSLLGSHVRNARTRILPRILADPARTLLAIDKAQPVQVVLSSHIESVTVRILTRPSLGARHKTEQKYAEATVVIVDDFGDGVPGATVQGSFTGNLLRRPQAASGTTDSDGKVTLTLGKSVGWDGSFPLSFTFCVDAVDSSPSWDGDEACATGSY